MKSDAQQGTLWEFKGKAVCLQCPLQQCLKYTLLLRRSQGNAVAPPQQAGMCQPYPKAQLYCFRPRHHSSSVKTKPQEDSGWDSCPSAASHYPSTLCAQQGLCPCWSCIHTWLCCVGLSPLVVTDYSNYNSSKAQYFFIHMVCTFKNQINNRLPSIPSSYKWQ